MKKLKVAVFSDILLDNLKKKINKFLGGKIPRVIVDIKYQATWDQEAYLMKHSAMIIYEDVEKIRL